MGTLPYAYALELSFTRGIYNFLLTGHAPAVSTLFIPTS